MIKRSILMFFLVLIASVAHSNDAKHGSMDHKVMHGMKVGAFTEDSRVSLNLSPMMKQHQLANMRGHLDAIHKIVLLMAENDFDEASLVASKQLGMTDKMKAMCSSFENETFKSMGMAFHKSGDVLAKTLKTGDLNASLRALNTTMSSCVSCHATFRQ